MDIFSAANILLPRVKSMEKWSVIACDQFSAQPEYWQQVREEVGNAPSAFHLILPEAELGQAGEEERITAIHKQMEAYLDQGLFEQYEHAYIYVERTLADGSIRKGVIGMVDLEAYDYKPGAISPIRCTEKTVLERIPPRMKVRWNAPLELPHVLLLCDDEEKTLIEPIAMQKNQMQKVYDFSLMKEGGNITGWILKDAILTQFEERLELFAQKASQHYRDLEGAPVIFAVGDGNHSLATAKACYERLKQENPQKDFSHHPARYALVELENLHDEAQVFEPIHRVIFNTEPIHLLAALQKECAAETGYPISWYMNGKKGMLYLDANQGELAVAILQNFLDRYLERHDGKIDYIHGDDELKKLASRENAIGFMLPVMEKNQLFRGVIADGALPRKTFSMGKAQEKRYYLEARLIR